ncbi:MAG: glycosyltransferase family 39 protein [Xanthomonadaceae bacterium]|nr:glycosyltransferase family 39 protein [Xanthomonadaceae bacterium]MDE1963268.1 glycosyltransferase family 39 protein [Xanthomonadaceae bacterium]
MRDPSSVVAPVTRWRAAFLTVFAVQSVIKLWLAATLAPFTDEAFYWLESRHPAWGYSDLPPLTAWLIRGGEAVAGHGVLGMRWPFLLLGAALPWIVVRFAREAFDARTGWQAGLLCLLLPLAGTLGVLALPDVPLTVAIMLAVLALLRVASSNRSGDWLLLGGALALAWMTHYRAAMAMLVGLTFLLFAPRGRGLWRRRGLWLALSVTALGLVPLAVSNWRQHGAGIAFQLVDRNPWRFHAGALVQPLEQALACTPLLYAMLLWAAWQAWRRRGEGAPWDVAAFVSGGFLGLYFVLGLFADDVRFRAHWPLPGYLPLLAVLPVLVVARPRPVARRWLWAAAVVAALGQALGLAWLGMAATPGGATRLVDFKAFPYAFVGWREAAALVARTPGDGVLVADNFALAAELAFALDDREPVYSLDSPLNAKHGRSPQLAAWGLDEAGLRRTHAGQPMRLAVEEAAQGERERFVWLGSICRRIDAPRPLARLSLYDGRKRVALYAGTVPEGPPGRSPADVSERAGCRIWQAAHAADVLR